MSHNSEEKVPVVASVGKLVLTRSPKRNPTKHQRPGVAGEFLLAHFPLFADNLKSLQVSQSALGDADRRQRRLKLSEGRTRDSGRFRNSAFGPRAEM